MNRSDRIMRCDDHINEDTRCQMALLHTSVMPRRLRDVFNHPTALFIPPGSAPPVGMNKLFVGCWSYFLEPHSEVENEDVALFQQISYDLFFIIRLVTMFHKELDDWMRELNTLKATRKYLSTTKKNGDMTSSAHVENVEKLKKAKKIIIFPDFLLACL